MLELLRCFREHLCITFILLPTSESNRRECACCKFIYPTNIYRVIDRICLKTPSVSSKINAPSFLKKHFSLWIQRLCGRGEPASICMGFYEEIPHIFQMTAPPFRSNKAPMLHRIVSFLQNPTLKVTFFMHCKAFRILTFCGKSNFNFTVKRKFQNVIIISRQK